MTPPIVPPIVHKALELARPLLRHDSDETGWPVRLWLTALLGADQLLWALAEEPGFAETLRPENAAAELPEWLAFIGACNGALLEESMTTEQRLVEIRHPSGWALGLPSTMLAKVAEFLVDGAEPVLLPHTKPGVPGDQPDDITLRIRIQDVLPGRLMDLIAAFDAQQIEGDHGHVTTAAIWGEEAETHTTWGAAAAAHATWGDMSRGH